MSVAMVMQTAAQVCKSARGSLPATGLQASKHQAGVASGTKQARRAAAKCSCRTCSGVVLQRHALGAGEITMCSWKRQ